MTGTAGEVRTRARALLPAMLASAIVIIVPAMLMPGADTASVTAAALLVGVAALLRLCVSGASRASQSRSVVPPTDDMSPVLIPGRVTDPVHHPLRPRAPGLA
jgi:hypothetical protein